jgi:zinc protease
VLLSLALAGLLAYAPPGPPAPPTLGDAIAPVEITLPQRASPSPFEFETFAGDPLAVKQFVLANGLTVLLSENHEQAEVFGAVVVRTGGKNDPADNTGMAHYLEHMLFKGTQSLGTSNWAAEQPLQVELVELFERHKQATSADQRAAIQAEIAETVAQTYAYAIPNELDKMLGEIGSTGVNAFTTEDETVYYNRFPASQIDPWLAIYAHRFVDPVFRLFPTELEAVYEEKNVTMDRFEVRLYERFIEAAFPDHPYGTQSVIGETEHLKSPSLVAMQDYFDRYYVANNMALVLSGDFDAEAIMPIIAERFGTWRRGPDPQPRTGTVEPFVGRELVKLRITPVRVGAYAFRTPTPRDPDYAALQVMRELLSNDQGSGYIDTLVSEGKILIALPFPITFADHGLDIVFFAPRIFGQSFKRAEGLVLDQFRRIAAGEFDEATMLAIRDGLRRAEDRQWEDNEDRALALADSFVRRDSWQGYLDYREQLSQVSREDVMRVAASYFGDDHLALRSRLGIHKPPRLTKPSYPAVEPQVGAQSSFYAQVMARPSAPPKLDYVEFDRATSSTGFARAVETTPIAEGVVLRSNQNPFNDTYSLDLVFGVGSDRYPELEVAAEYVERIGTREHSPTGLRERLSLLGTSMAISVTQDRMHVRLTGPEQQLGPALALLDGVLREPVADPKRWKALRREHRALERVERNDPGELAAAARQFAMYGPNSSYLRGYGRRGLAKLDPNELLDAWARAQTYALEIRYTGQQSASEVAERVRESLTLSGPREPEVEFVHYPRVLPARDTVYFLPHRKLIQTQLMFVVDGDPVEPSQHAVANAYGEYMGGGMGGLVFQEIREFRALAYSAWAGFLRDDTPIQAGYLVAGAGCQADKTQETIEVMLDLIRTRPDKTERMDALRSSLIRGLEALGPDFRELQSTIAYWQKRGYTEDPREHLLDAYATTQFADIEAFHAAQIAGRPVTLVVVGDPRRVDKRELARFGELIELREREIFAR